MKLEGKVVIVAGAGPGIGEGTVKVLASEGADIAVVDINEAEAKRIAEDVKKAGCKAVAIKADLTDEEECKKVVETTLDTLGRLDGVVNVVGGLGKPFFEKTTMDFVDETEEEWDVVFKLNLMTAIFMCQAVIPIFVKQGYGKIVNTASECAQYGHLPFVSSYCCSKAAVAFFTKNLAYVMAKHNINVNALCPGRVYTPGFHEKVIARQRELSPEAYEGKTNEETFLEAAKTCIPMQRPQSPEDIGYGVVFLLSDEADNVTGMLMNIDGGSTI